MLMIMIAISGACFEASALYEDRSDHRDHDDRFDNSVIVDGVDVSIYQDGKIDWSSAKESGIDFAIMRVTLTRNKTGKLEADNSFEHNYKEASDAAKGAIFTKFAKEIAVAVKAGGADPNGNSRLKVVVAKAKAANMPNDNINRAIKKAAEAGEGDDYEEITYEGYGPAGVAIMAKALTNNRNRTAADVRHIFDKNGGNLGVDGSVSFLFEEKGTILVSKEDFEDEDQVMGDALDCGASDFDSDDDYYIISTSPSDFYSVRDALEAKGYTFADETLGPVAITTTEVTDPEAVERLEKMLDMFDENEDVQEVYHNWNG